MAVVAISESEVWFAARWAFRWLMDQAIAGAGDERTRVVFEQASALDGLHLHLLESEGAARAQKVLLKVAQRAARGQLPEVEVEGRVLDAGSQLEFRSAASDLVKLLQQDDV
jgi:hypothetical protein